LYAQEIGSDQESWRRLSYHRGAASSKITLQGRRKTRLGIVGLNQEVSDIRWP